MTKLSAIALVIVSTVFTTTAQLLYKHSIGGLSLSFKGILLNAPLIGGVILYGIAALLFIHALKNGELSVLFPIFATGFVWVALISIAAFGERSTFLKWAGISAIVLGTALLGIRRQK